MNVLPTFSEFLIASGDVAYEWDLRTDLITWYGAWEKLFGVDAIPPTNSESFYKIIHPEDRHLVFGAEESTIDRQYRVRDTNETLILAHERGSTESENGHVIKQRGILRAVDRNVNRSAQQDVYGRDLLTGCYDRAGMLIHITKMLESSQAVRRTFAYMVVGIDKMSFVNEAIGMEAGDALLRGVAERLSNIMPSRCLLARVGGDMFGILLPRPLGDDIKTVAEHILQSFRDHPVLTSVTPLHITVSIGAIRLPTIARNATEAMIFAEQAFHDAHQRGRNLFVEYLDQPERVQGTRQMLELGERIKHAFKNNGFRLAYQPIVDASTGEHLFYEALVRMFSDDGKPISAALFVPAIEQMGLAFQLDRLVMDMAITEMEAYPNLSLAINISGLSASNAEWSEHMQTVLSPRPDVARRLIIEITETAALVDVDETKRFVDLLRKLGGRVSLDDFGAGATSIRHLRSLSLSIMKIDKDLLHKILIQPEQQHLVRMLIELGRGLGLQTVAEGIESEEVAIWLRKEHIDMLQGYYFGKPTLDRPWLTTKSGGGMPSSSTDVPKSNPTTGSTTGPTRFSSIIAH